MSAASLAEAMILLILSMWSATGLIGTRPRSDPTGPVPCWGPAARTAASSSVGVAPAIWAAAVEPADVPMVRSAVVTSNPASNSPALTPISHALPGGRSRLRLPQSRDREMKRSTHCGYCVHGTHLLAMDHDRQDVSTAATR